MHAYEHSVFIPMNVVVPIVFTVDEASKLERKFNASRTSFGGRDLFCRSERIAINNDVLQIQLAFSDQKGQNEYNLDFIVVVDFIRWA